MQLSAIGKCHFGRGTRQGRAAADVEDAAAHCRFGGQRGPRIGLVEGMGNPGYESIEDLSRGGAAIGVEEYPKLML